VARCKGSVVPEQVCDKKGQDEGECHLLPPLYYFLRSPFHQHGSGSSE
jgi:hypothetical protein